MREYIDNAVFLSEARMMWSDCHVLYILVEGASDKTFFTTLFGKQPQIQFKPLFGWEKVYETICLAKRESFPHIYGVIDSDYHQVNQDGVTESSQLFFTDQHDIEMMLFLSNSFDKFLSVCADEARIKNYPNARAPILTAASYLGALRAISLKGQYHFHFDGFECKDYIDRNTLNANCKKVIEKIVQRTASQGKCIDISTDDLGRKVDTFIEQYGVLAACNGHDVLEVLSIAMAKLYASTSATRYTSESLFDFLLLGYTTAEFQKSSLYSNLACAIHTSIPSLCM